ncbi:MAG: hypothetical protein EON93_14330 [Burkholderiales bacterium]|nr:MAG: hypothetical protein EON93_14330 [Burkholderiales bacterium]
MRAGGVSVLALLIVAGCDDAPPAATLSEVPAKFVGQWEEKLEDCAAGGAWSVTVTPTQVKFPDSAITVTGVAPDGGYAARVDGTFASADAEWNGSVRLELADSGSKLSVVNGSQLAPRVKCP